MNQNHHYDKISELVKELPNGKRLLGLDVGSKKIGLAVSDSRMKVATAIDTIHRTKFKHDIEQLNSIVEDRLIGGLVIGLPISMNGTEGPACQSIRQFGLNVVHHLEINVTFWDERLSTSAIEKFLINEANSTRKQRAKIIDKLAATYILQGAIDSL